MSEPVDEELRQVARRVLGRDPTPKEAAQAAPRLLILSQTMDRLEAWQGELGEVAPATIFQVPTEAR
ncbi:hypothetical protein, partial [Siccirubricoccus deserti]